jgi:hypothetical protein
LAETQKAVQKLKQILMKSTLAISAPPQPVPSGFPYHGCDQSSTVNPGTRANSRTLFGHQNEPAADRLSREQGINRAYRCSLRFKKGAYLSIGHRSLLIKRQDRQGQQKVIKRLLVLGNISALRNAIPEFSDHDR